MMAVKLGVGLHNSPLGERHLPRQKARPSDGRVNRAFDRLKVIGGEGRSTLCVMTFYPLLCYARSLCSAGDYPPPQPITPPEFLLNIVD